MPTSVKLSFPLVLTCSHTPFDKNQDAAIWRRININYNSHNSYYHLSQYLLDCHTIL